MRNIFRAIKLEILAAVIERSGKWTEQHGVCGYRMNRPKLGCLIRFCHRVKTHDGNSTVRRQRLPRHEFKIDRPIQSPIPDIRGRCTTVPNLDKLQLSRRQTGTVGRHPGIVVDFANHHVTEDRSRVRRSKRTIYHGEQLAVAARPPAERYAVLRRTKFDVVREPDWLPACVSGNQPGVIRFLALEPETERGLIDYVKIPSRNLALIGRNLILEVIRVIVANVPAAHSNRRSRHIMQFKGIDLRKVRMAEHFIDNNVVDRT